MVKAWKENVVIPTYEVGKPEKNPMFMEKRVYQGSSGVVYPYPVIESIADEKVDKEWEAIYLENEYIKVMVLPQLGGRIQMAYDKLRQRHFVYYNHVIKPALVGLTGPWISGGIEFNWPQHHRPSTYLPVDATIKENADGSVTVWVNEMERMFHQKGLAGFTLRPGCAYLEVHGRLYNRTALPQTFLWWANPAVEVNDAYQSVFPPDVNAVFDHGKRAVSSFPIATGTYYKMDYSAGVDISNYRNIKVPTSYMAVNSKYNFEGGYENDTKAGMLHVASNHFSPGKKQWTWGNGDFGRAWDRNLTDEVEGVGFRPYIELMAGVYTENQPDFTWLMPYEEKQFTQYFMPYRELGVVKQATKDLIVNIYPVTDSTKGDEAIAKTNALEFKVFATSKQEVHIVLTTKYGEVLYDKQQKLSPEKILTEQLSISASLDQLRLTIYKELYGQERPVLTWEPEPDEIRPIPDSAEAALSPKDTKTIDQLYLTGLHLEQYRHATWSALDYYEEALRRDPLDYRCNNQIGLWYLRRGRVNMAEKYLRTAVRVLQRRNPNPYDGEPIYNLALMLKHQAFEEITNSEASNRKLSEAYDLFWKATWNKAWADAAFLQAAQISVTQGRLDDALDELDRALISNSHNHKALALKASVLRLMGRTDEALQLCCDALHIDPFNYGCIFEQYIMTKEEDILQKMRDLMHGNLYNYHELALDYLQAGLRKEVQMVLDADACTAASPLTFYYEAYAATDQDTARRLVEQAEATSSEYCFPNRLEDIVVLRFACDIMQPQPAAHALYYLGCLYYDKRQYNLAAQYWYDSAQAEPAAPTTWRNLALHAFNKLHDSETAMDYMVRAFKLDTTDARVLMELDQLYKVIGRLPERRLALLQQYMDLVNSRDDLLLEYITLLNQCGRHSEAMQLIDAHQFHPWEGGEGKVSGQYQMCRLEIAKKLLTESKGKTEDTEKLQKAKQLLEECLVYPPHLGEGKLYGAQDNDFLYFLGRYEEGTAGPTEPAAAMYYNDAKPDKIFYAALCYRKLGQEDKARSLFNRLISYGSQHLFDEPIMDYFAVSLPDLLIWEDSLKRKNEIHCKYMLALGYFGLGDKEHGERYLYEMERLDPNHLGAQALRTALPLLDFSH